MSSTPPSATAVEPNARRCPGCGQPLPPGAAFCRGCGTRYEPPAVPTETVRRPSGEGLRQPKRRRQGGSAILAGVAIVLVGLGVALAIVLADGGKTSATTVVVDEESEPAVVAGGATVTAARYVQAGSFKTSSHAEAERQRLAAAGIEVDVIASDGAQQLYPGFQVLLAGPLETAATEKRVLSDLHRNGVPSAFARPLSPALAIGDPSAVAGTWLGEVERTNSDRPTLNGTLATRLELDADGEEGTLLFTGIDCQVVLFAPTLASTTVSYQQDGLCVGTGEWRLRLNEGELMLALLPPDTNSFVLGTLSPT